MKHYYKIYVAYDGTDYFGWQIQKDKISIAHVLQKIFKDVFEQEIKLVGASRTDAGVHALGQVATFKTELELDPETVLKAWNNSLPTDIMIRSLEQVDDMFHPRYQVKKKIYWYHFFLERPLPFVQRYGWFVRLPIDLNKLEKSLPIFVGSHDFRSFCTGNEMEDTVRTIENISLEFFKRYGAYRITFKGPGFLRHMIRRIVGACLDVASRDTLSIECLQEVLEKKDPRQILLNAPAKGLLLYKIMY